MKSIKAFLVEFLRNSLEESRKKFLKIYKGIPVPNPLRFPELILKTKILRNPQRNFFRSSCSPCMILYLNFEKNPCKNHWIIFWKTLWWKFLEKSIQSSFQGQIPGGISGRKHRKTRGRIFEGIPDIHVRFPERISEKNPWMNPMRNLW